MKLDRLRPGDRVALSVWGGAWLSVMLFVATIPRVLPSVYDGRPFLDRWAQWDAVRFLNLAKYGYDGVPGQPDPGWPAFFPGYPMLLHGVGWIVTDYRLAGLGISLVTGAIAAVAMSRLGESEGAEGTGPRAAAALIASPAAVFLFAGYSESVFLACAIPAWLLARRGRWQGAVFLAALASTVRITGLFLGLALIVEYLVGDYGRRKQGWRLAPWLLLPFVPLVLYTIYQHGRTGDWLAWQTAQEAGWNRHFVGPWSSLKQTWWWAFQYESEYALAFRMELVAGAVGVGLTIYLLAKRRWPEFTYIGLQVVALITSTFYMSVGRATLLWWPLWIGIGSLATRRPAVYTGLMALSVPIAVLWLVLFTTGGWSG